MIIQTVENCKKAGIYMLEGNIMLGAAGETKEQLLFQIPHRFFSSCYKILALYLHLKWRYHRKTESFLHSYEANFDFAEQLIIAGKGMIQIYPVLLWPFPNTPITLNPSKYGVKIIEEQCEYTVNCISNCVSESESDVIIWQINIIFSLRNEKGIHILNGR